MKKRGGFIWVWILIIIAILILLAVLYFGRARHAAVPVTTSVTATPGQTVQGFPRAFILDPAAALTASQAVSYPSSTMGYTADFDSAMTMNQLYTAYVNFFKQYHWIITNNITNKPNSRGLYAIDGNDTLSVSIADQTTLRQVTLNYVVVQ